MFSTVQHKFAGALSHFGYDSKPSEGLPEKIYKTLENQDFTTETPLHEYRIAPKPPSIWNKVVSFAMSYLLFSSGESSLQQSTQTSWMPAVGLEPLALMASLSLFPDFAYAQSLDTTFFEAFGGEDTDVGWALTAFSEGSLIVSGNSFSFGAGSDDVLLSKFSSNGTLLWANTLGGTSSENSRALILTHEGDLIIAGYTTSFGAGGVDMLLSKFSSNGTLLWSHVFGNTRDEYGFALTPTLEGSLIVTGCTDSFGAGSDDLLLAKFSSNGTLVWANTLGGTGEECGMALMATSEGDLNVAGYTSSFGAGGYDVLLAKYSSNGMLVWANTLGGTGEDWGRALLVTSEGDVIVTGYTSSFGAGDYDVLLAKYSSNGTLVWANAFGGASDDQGVALMATSEGDLIVAGSTSSFSAGSSDVLLSKFLSNGTLVWANALGGTDDDKGLGLTVTSEGNLIVAGYTTSFGTSSINMLLAKFNAQGGIENCSAWHSVTPQVQSITPNITDVTLNMTIGIPPWTGQDARSALNVTDITSLMNQTTVCYEQTAVSRTPTTSPQTFLSGQTSSDFSDTEGSSSISSSKSKIPSSSSAIRNASPTSAQSSFFAPSAQSTSIESSQGTGESGIVSSSKSKIQSFSSSISNASPTSARSSFSAPSSQSTSMPVSSSNPSITEIPEPSTGTNPSITTLFYDQHYSIIVNGETIGIFYFTGGSGQLDSNNTNTLNIQLDGDIEDGETITLFTIPAGEEPLWEDIILSYESESGCITTEGVFTTTSEEEHSYQLIFESESSECSQSMATLKLAAIPVFSGGIL